MLASAAAVAREELERVASLHVLLIRRNSGDKAAHRRSPHYPLR